MVKSIAKKVKPKKTSLFLSKWAIIASLALVICAVLASFYFYSQYQKSQMLLNNPSEAARLEVADLLSKIGQLIELPTEQPEIATVSDLKKLKDQPFFANALLGDKVLIFNKARQAILYRPSTNKIILVAPINFGVVMVPSSSPTASAGATLVSVTPAPSVTPEPIKVAIYNGSKTVGLAAATEKKLKGEMSNIEVVVKANTKGDYTKTIIIDLSNNQNENASEIASILGGEVGLLPSIETKPANADILVILGK